jgi:hypothetical protein
MLWRYKSFNILSASGVVVILTFLTLLFALFLSPASHAATTATPSSLQSYSTIRSIGIEWDIVGDSNHDASVTVRYRQQGASVWKNAMPLFRIDYNGRNMFAGSILFLNPGTTYEVELNLTDPDGGADSRTITVSTKAVPQEPTGGRTFHVIPGTGGGDGSQSNPYQGITAAQANAQPGDIFLLHAGSYGAGITFNKAGTAGNHIVWKSAGDGDAVFNGVIVAADYVWLNGLIFSGAANALKNSNAPTGVVLTNNTFSGCHYCIWLNSGGTGWYITDNVIVGDVPVDSNSLGGEGIQLGGNDHVVAYNSVTSVADGISSGGGKNIDVYNNDIFDVSDDGIEPDHGYENVRVWRNRIHNAVHNGISFQPMNSAPWYILRNQIVGSRQSPLKLRTVDQVLLAHNTMVGWGQVQTSAQYLRRMVSRNNLWISVTGSYYMWEDGSTGTPADWRTDLDYDGFDWNSATVNVFKWLNVRYPDLASLSAAAGIEQHGIVVDKWACFETFNVPAAPPAPVPPQVMTLNPACNAIDAGDILPNINDGYTGSAPDLGAYELGAQVPTYGPRTQANPPPPSTPQCSDSIDNDNDGLTDYPSDPGCSSATDNDEYNPPPADTTPPTAPTNLSATAISSSQISLTWGQSSDNVGVTSYNIYRNGSLLTNTNANTTSYDDTGLNPNTSYAYEVSALDAAGNESQKSQAVSITTPPATPLPFAITNLTPASYQVRNDLQVGSTVYIDRVFTYTSIPNQLLGSVYIQTANSDKTSSGTSFISFSTDTDASVYVAHDARITTKPSWLSSFIDTGLTITNTDTTLNVYKKDFPAGTITLGGNGGTYDRSMYVVIVKPGQGGAGNTILALAPRLEAVSSAGGHSFTIEIIDTAGGSVLYAFTATPDADGQIIHTAPVGAGVYHLRISSPRYLPRKLLDQPLQSNQTILLPQLPAGNLKEDNIINSLDWSLMNNAWFTSDAAADLDENGVVNSLDFSYINGNWGLIGE